MFCISQGNSNEKCKLNLAILMRELYTFIVCEKIHKGWSDSTAVFLKAYYILGRSIITSWDEGG